MIVSKSHFPKPPPASEAIAAELISSGGGGTVVGRGGNGDKGSKVVPFIADIIGKDCFWKTRAYVTLTYLNETTSWKVY